MRTIPLLSAALLLTVAVPVLAADPEGWPQWRGPTRDGKVAGPKWPDKLSDDTLELLWRVPLGQSYSGPIVSGDLVYTTETKNKATEKGSAIALDQTGMLLLIKANPKSFELLGSQ